MEPKDFGRLIFEWRSGLATTIAIGMAAALLVIGATATGEPLVIGAALVIAGGLGVAAAASVVGTLRCYERGLVKRTLFGERQLPYSDVEVFSYAATRVVGLWAQTNVRIDLVPAKPHRKISLFGRHRQGVDDFRDAVSAAIARKMLDRLASEPEVAWTKHVHLSRQGVRFEKPKLIGRENVFIPFSAESVVSFHDGVFNLAGQETGMAIGVGAPNFFPGYQAMRALAGSTVSDRP